MHSAFPTRCLIQSGCQSLSAPRACKSSESAPAGSEIGGYVWRHILKRKVRLGVSSVIGS